MRTMEFLDIVCIPLSLFTVLVLRLKSIIPDTLYLENYKCSAYLVLESLKICVLVLPVTKCPRLTEKNQSGRRMGLFRMLILTPLFKRLSLSYFFSIFFFRKGIFAV